MTPQRTDPDLPMSVQESPLEVWVDGGWLGVLSAVRAQDLLKKVIIFITSTIVWPQVKQQGGKTAPPFNRKLD